MEHQVLLNKLASLESINDQLSAEVDYIDRLLKVVGFPQGIASAAEVAKSMLDDSQKH